MEYVETADKITPEQLQGFFSDWSDPPSPKRLLAILKGSDHVVLAIETQSQRVIGLITAISDGVSCAYIPHLEVLEAYRKQGIGSELVNRLLAQIGPLYMIDLICDTEVQSFYAPLGFRPYSAMIRRNYERQSCK